MAWWAWLLVDVGIVLVAIVILGLIGLGVYNRYKSLMRNVREFADALPKVDTPTR